MLTEEEEKWIKNQVKIKKLEKDIEAINKTAFEATQAKLAEIQAIENQRAIDVKQIQDQIDALKEKMNNG